MKKISYYKLIGLTLFAFLFSLQDSFSQDTVWVQTLTFDDITKRRGAYIFPDNPQKYRKILMYYTLKCDRQTARDIFDCGEWDYSAYCRIHKHIGVMDSNLIETAKYNWGRGIPEKLCYTDQRTYDQYINKYTETLVDSVISETEYEIKSGSSTMSFNAAPTKFQVLLTRDLLKDKEMTGKTFSRMKLNILTPGVTLKNFKLKALLSSEKNLDEFETGDFVTLYEGDITFENQGWSYINFNETFTPNMLQGAVLQFSYDSIEGGDKFSLAAYDFENCLITENSDGYLEFDGGYDYTLSDDISELRGARKFTVEMRLRIHQWRGGGYIFSLNNVLDFRTVSEYNQPRRYYWRFSDSAGYGIMVGGNVDVNSNWIHFALAYDGTKSQYDGRINFYINGSPVTGYIRGKFPEAIPDVEQILKLNRENGNVKCDIDEFRIWKDVVERETLNEWANKTIDENHPNSGALVVYYTMDEINNNELIDESGNDYNSVLIGAPIKREFRVEDLFKNQRKLARTPQFVLCEGEYETTQNEYFDTTKIFHSPMSLVTYELNDKETEISDIKHCWEPGTYYTYDQNGSPIDSTTFETTDSLSQDTIKYYSDPYEITDQYEIARYITPYGKGLSLGQDGFTWIYDVTEYAPLLKGEVDLSAHNQQELIDLKFAFIEGTPPRDVLRINRPWGPRSSYRYKHLDDNSQLSAVEVDLLPETETLTLRARLTGHGHHSDDGDYPHCCEWKDNTHYIYANGEEISSWHIWRFYECGLNPVFPQGGTWPGQREGWCPGDIVYNYDFELSDYIEDNSIEIDYGITPVPDDNQGMGNGSYHIAMHLFEFSEPNHSLDAEVYEVITPNKIPYYSRLNPICAPPNVVIRNNGAEPLTSLKFAYSVSGGEEKVYHWTGNLPSMSKDTIELPIESSEFWLGDDNHLFSVTISEPNGEEDEYEANDAYQTEFTEPDLYDGSMVIWYKTNNEPQYYTYEIKDLDGNVVFSKSNLDANTLYKDEIALPDGCYTLEFFSMRQTGLSYWAYPNQGSGYLRIYDNEENLLKSFNPDFGAGVIYAFDLGGVLYIKDPGYENLARVYPNPAREMVNISIDYLEGAATMEIYDLSGALISEEEIVLEPSFQKSVDVTTYSNGTYIMRIVSADYDIIKKFAITR